MSDYKQKLELLWRFDGKMTLDHMGLLVHYMTHQGDSWVFTARNVCKHLGIGIEKYLKLKKDLQEAGLITSSVIKEHGKNAGSVIRVNFTWNANNSAMDCFSDIGKSDTGNSDTGKSDIGNSDTGKSDIGKSGQHIKKDNYDKEGDYDKNGDNDKEGDNLKSERRSQNADAFAPVTHSQNDALQKPFTASEYSENDEEDTSFFEEFGQPEQPKAKKTRKAKTSAKFEKPSLEELTQYIRDKISEKHLTGWNEQQVINQGEIIWNYYESNGWKVGKNSMKSWQGSVSHWLSNQNWMPRNTGNSAGRQKTFKEIDQENRDRPFTHREEHLIEIAAKRILSTNSTEVLEGLPECLRDDALKLAEKMRKEQGDKPKVRLLF